MSGRALEFPAKADNELAAVAIHVAKAFLRAYLRMLPWVL